MNKPQIVLNDPWLEPYSEHILKRQQNALKKEQELLNKSIKSLADFATGYMYFGLHRTDSGWVFREWAPNAQEIYMIGDFSDWKQDPRFKLNSIGHGNWEIELNKDDIKHGQKFRLFIRWKNGQGERIPAWINRVIQNPDTLAFDAQVWSPEEPYEWKIPHFERKNESLLIYEAHAGMATEEHRVGTYNEFTHNILPRIQEAGYNTIQLMAVMEHPYYGSFGYHISSFFAVSSRFGTPEDLKLLVDTAHSMGISVIMDLVHSHAVKNELEGLNRFDGTPYQYFHSGERRNHPAWDSLCFNYGKNEVVHFLLSNCKYWLEEYKFDGFRYDGVTSMLYLDHGLSKDFVNLGMYFDNNQDEDAISYLMLSNKLVHEVNPNAITIAEEMSGMPGTATPFEMGGYGFDYRLAMGTPDYWIKIIKNKTDEHWNVGEIYYELTRKRHDEKTISYAESHDQALVGDKTIVFRLMDKEIYYNMHKRNQNLIVDRAMALHKIIRLLTVSTAGNGYLNFMGNEFGHPEWIDFPRAGNNWSYKYARRQWSLVDNQELKYHYLSDFDKEMINLIKHENLFHFPWTELLHEDQGQQILAYKRGELIFIFNLNPFNSLTDYEINIAPGKYKILLNTDSSQFGGNGLVDESMTYYAMSTDGKISSRIVLKLYLPCRIGLVLKKLPSKSLYDL
jgi:1,4-alpha-glucan branching enzyme